ncbi:MAG: DUF839 domain-containing protein [Gammaproteobacteria bacterium]|nr:DUF839 domain-containing protein [Gammaproteobacteria bacterium]
MVSRRDLLGKTLLGMGAAPLIFGAPIARGAVQLQPTKDKETGLPLLMLPEGFTYRSMSWTGDPLTTGGLVPDRHDGMAVVDGAGKSEAVLLRNHERYFGDAIQGEGTPVYDDFKMPAQILQRVGAPLGAAGGVTGVVISEGQYRETVPLIGGTMINCAGGPTPWGTWLTCEEVLFRGSNIRLPDGSSAKDHGYVFEVPPPHLGKASAVPIKDMGFFRHEAVAIDSKTGYAYLTEDNGPNSGFYRFVPNNLERKVGALEDGGNLSMLKVKGQANANLIASPEGAAFDVEWVAVNDPDADPEVLNSYGNGFENLMGQGKSGPFLQGEAGGGATFSRGEGIWEYDGRLYWIDTAGGPAGTGSVWLYDPIVERLVCIYASGSEDEADAIDNIAVNPVNGMIVLCEDGGGVHHQNNTLKYGCRLLIAKQPGHEVITFAENNLDLSNGVPGRPEIGPEDYRTSEWAGATFTRDGQTLYANIQSPGVTFAIQGPWGTL